MAINKCPYDSNVLRRGQSKLISSEDRQDIATPTDTSGRLIIIRLRTQ
jgi:hypothetical protein